MYDLNGLGWIVGSVATLPSAENHGDCAAGCVTPPMPHFQLQLQFIHMINVMPRALGHSSLLQYYVCLLRASDMVSSMYPFPC